MVKIITYEQVKQYISDNIKADIIEDTKDHQLMIYFKTKIADEIDMINKLSFEDFEKPEHKEGELIKETEDYVATAITDAEFKELFGFAYPF